MQHESANPDQAALWNGTAGQAWVEMHGLLDRVLAPLVPLLIEPVLSGAARRVLDIGCGAGSTTLAVARGLTPGGQCLGVDISAPLITLARARALEVGFDRTCFVHADAQTHVFEWNSFDAVISRFGVMFFTDPVAAFINIRSAARSEAVLAFLSWRSPADNPFLTAATRAALPCLPALQMSDTSAPGQFGFADPDRVRNILEAAGWNNVDLRHIEVPLSIAEPDLLNYGTRLGPVGLALHEADDATRARTVAAVHAAYQPFVHDGAARFNAACWLVTARA